MCLKESANAEESAVEAVVDEDDSSVQGGREVMFIYSSPLRRFLVQTWVQPTRSREYHCKNSGTDTTLIASNIFNGDLSQERTCTIRVVLLKREQSQALTLRHSQPSGAKGRKNTAEAEEPHSKS